MCTSCYISDELYLYIELCVSLILQMVTWVDFWILVDMAWNEPRLS